MFPFRERPIPHTPGCFFGGCTGWVIPTLATVLLPVLIFGRQRWRDG
jgi:hypothetical protein